MDVLSITGYNRRPPHVVAEYKGFFAKENLEVRFHETTYAPDHNKGMAEGRWDFTLSSADTMIARTTTDGVDYMLFMQAEEGLSAYLIGQPGYDSIDKLRGKLLAGDPGDSNLDLIRKKILRTHGIDDTEYRHRNHRQLAGALGGISATARGCGDVDAAGFRQSVGRGRILLAERRRLRAGLAAHLRLDAAAVVVGSPRACRALHPRLGGGDGLVAASRRIARRPLQLSMDKEKLNRAAAEIAYSKVVPRARINPAAHPNRDRAAQRDGRLQTAFRSAGSGSTTTVIGERGNAGTGVCTRTKMNSALTGDQRDALNGSVEQRAQDHADDTEDDGAEKSRPETGDDETWHEVGGEHGASAR